MCLRVLATGTVALAAGQISFISRCDWHFHTQARVPALSLCVVLFNTFTPRADIQFHMGETGMLTCTLGGGAGWGGGVPCAAT